MDESVRFRLLVVAVGVLLFGGWVLFTETARWYGRQAVDWHELPPPVREAVLHRFGEIVVLEIERGPSVAPHATYRIRVSAPQSPTVRLWLAADGTDWPPADMDAAASETSADPRD